MLYFIKFENFCSLNFIVTGMRRQVQTRKKYLQISIYLIKDLNAECIKNSQNSIISKDTI